MAEKLGADIVVDPRDTLPYKSPRSVAAAFTPDRAGRVTTMFPEYAQYRPSVVFGCVGVPGVVQQILHGAAPCSKIVVAVVSMEHDAFQPIYGVLKENDIAFCMASSADDCGQALGHLTSGELQLESLITSRIQLNEVPNAFAGLANPEKTHKFSSSKTVAEGGIEEFGLREGRPRPLANKVIAITGGARAIGCATVRALGGCAYRYR